MALSVVDDSDAGWDKYTPPNESVDEDGQPSSKPMFSVPDPRAPARRAYDDPEVVALRDYLQAHNGLPGLEICGPDEVARATRIFHRDGFVVVRDLLNPQQLARFRAGCARVLDAILAVRGTGKRRYMTETGRLPHRYSYGTCSASRHMMHEPEWAAMIDLPTTTPLLQSIFGTPDYQVWGGGGDLCLPGAIEYQHLHADLRDDQVLSPQRLQHAQQLGIELRTYDGSNQLTARTQGLVVERTPPMVTINFLMSDLTWENGPIRQIPGTQARQQRPPTPADEPEWMRLSTLVGAPAGAGVFRDTRAWHGATPNLSRQIRAMPNIEYAAPWTPPGAMARSMPHAVWETLTPLAQSLCRYIKADPGVWPPGAGVSHPLASARLAAQRAPS